MHGKARSAAVSNYLHRRSELKSSYSSDCGKCTSKCCGKEILIKFTCMHKKCGHYYNHYFVSVEFLCVVVYSRVVASTPANRKHDDL